MKLHELRPAKGAVKRRKRVGCGPSSGHGGSSTRGTKGQQSRSGGGVPAWFEGGQMPLQRRIPKRGFKNFMRKEYQIVNLRDLARFEAGSEVGPLELYKAGLITKKALPVKLLAKGEIDRSLTIKVNAASKAAVSKVEGAGGKVEILGNG